jgi:hypothetical protein
LEPKRSESEPRPEPSIRGANVTIPAVAQVLTFVAATALAIAFAILATT